MVTAESLGKRFDGRWVLRRVEFCLVAGECLLVTGPNGSGKSTLLKLVAALETPSEGEVTADIGDPRTGLGFSSIELRLYPGLTAQEHLALSAQLRGVEARTDELLDLVGLILPKPLPTSAYSTGMRARLRIALALQAKPKLLILDEPGAGLDERGIAILDRIVEEQRRRGCVIVATNDPRERRFGDLELRLGC